MEGIVKWFSAQRGYGFIVQPDGEDLFVHYSAIEGKGFRCLETGEMVKYDVIIKNERKEASGVRKL